MPLLGSGGFGNVYDLSNPFLINDIKLDTSETTFVNTVIKILNKNNKELMKNDIILLIHLSENKIIPKFYKIIFIHKIYDEINDKIDKINQIMKDKDKKYIFGIINEKCDYTLKEYINNALINYITDNRTYITEYCFSGNYIEDKLDDHFDFLFKNQIICADIKLVNILVKINNKQSPTIYLNDIDYKFCKDVLNAEMSTICSIQELNISKDNINDIYKLTLFNETNRLKNGLFPLYLEYFNKLFDIQLNMVLVKELLQKSTQLNFADVKQKISNFLGTTTSYQISIQILNDIEPQNINLENYKDKLQNLINLQKGGTTDSYREEGGTTDSDSEDWARASIPRNSANVTVDAEQELNDSTDAKIVSSVLYEQNILNFIDNYLNDDRKRKIINLGNNISKIIKEIDKRNKNMAHSLFKNLMIFNIEENDKFITFIKNIYVIIINNIYILYLYIDIINS